MSVNITAVKIDDELTPIHLIQANLIEEDIYNRRKPLRGEYTSRGVIKTNTIISGTISCRLTNDAAPALLYLITGKITDYRHVPETRSLFQKTLIGDYENPPEFSFIEITDEICYETPSLITTGFTIIQEEDAPLKLEINVKSSYGKTEIVNPEISKPETVKFFYLPEPMKIKANFINEPYLILDTRTPVSEKPLIIEAYSLEEYEANRYGKFIIQIENYQFQKVLNGSDGKSWYRYRAYRDLTVTNFYAGF